MPVYNSHLAACCMFKQAGQMNGCQEVIFCSEKEKLKHTIECRWIWCSAGIYVSVVTYIQLSDSAETSLFFLYFTNLHPSFVLFEAVFIRPVGFCFSSRLKNALTQLSPSGIKQLYHIYVLTLQTHKREVKQSVFNSVALRNKVKPWNAECSSCWTLVCRKQAR